MELAARVGDPVQHSERFAGGLLGLAAGIVIGVALVAAAPVALAGLGVLAATLAVGSMAGTVIGSAVVAEAVGETIGSHVAAPNAGDIADGAHTVFTGEHQPKQARMSDPLKCHSGQTIAEGSDSVFVEGWNASRKGDATMCGGKIQDGCPTVLIGGNAIGRAGSKNRSELPGWFQTLKVTLDWTGTILGFLSGKSEAEGLFIGGWKLAAQSVGTASKAYGATDAPGAKAVALAGGLAGGGTKAGLSFAKGTAVDAAKGAQGVTSMSNSSYNFFGGGPAPRTY